MLNPIKALKETYGGLPKEIYVLFIARIITRMGDFVKPFLVLFLTIKMGFSERDTGLIISIVGLTAFFGPMVGGYLGDTVGRKRVMVVAQGLSALMLIPCGFLGNSFVIVYLLAASSFFNSIVRPISSAMAIDLVSKEQRKSAFSLLYYGINIGVAIGPLLAGFLFYKFLPLLFIGDAATTLVSLLLIIKYIPETKMSHDEMALASEEADENEKIEKDFVLLAFLKRPILLGYTFFSMFSGFAYSQSNFALPRSMANVFGDELGPKFFGQIMSFNAVIVLLCTILLTRLTAKIRPIFVIAFSCILFAIGFGMMGHITALPLIYISVFIWTIGEIALVTNSGVFVASHTPISHRSRFSAIMGMISGLAFTVSPGISGVISDHLGMNSLWNITAGISMIAFIGLMYIGFADKRQNEI